MEFQTSNGEIILIPEMDINEDNCFGISIAARGKLVEYIKKKPSEENDITLAFLNSIIFKCEIALGRRMDI